jgi:NAD(P)-dependent dehydrogenase (short-subunit alcohol dehydrogenase family)
MNPLLQGKTALITGASQGFGLAVARAYAGAGANLVLCARDARALEQARAEVAAHGNGGQQVIARTADVSNEHDVAALLDTALAAFPTLDILVNNAGIYGPKGCIEDVDWQEWVKAIEINLFGSVLMCRAVLPHFKARRRGKIIQLSGGGATTPLPRISAYAASKAAVVRFIETLAEEVREYGIDVNAIAPGALNTRLLDEVLAAGPERVGQAFYERALQQQADGGADPARGAALAVFLASARSDGITGKLLSAVWDPWEQLPTHRADLDASDIYTLRRIVPKDRGKNWDEN